MPDIESDVDEPIVACLTCVQNYCGAKLTESQREHFNSDSSNILCAVCEQPIGKAQLEYLVRYPLVIQRIAQDIVTKAPHSNIQNNYLSVSTRPLATKLQYELKESVSIYAEVMTTELAAWMAISTQRKNIHRRRQQMMLYGVMLHNYRLSGQQKIATRMRRLQSDCHRFTIACEMAAITKLERIIDAATWVAGKACAEEIRLSLIE